MKKLVSLTLILFLAGIYAYGQYQVKTKFIITNEVDQTFEKLIFGINANATDSVDLSLGENYDLPPNPPQSELYGYFQITNPVSLERTSSFTDLRGLENTPSFYKKFSLRMQRGSGSRMFIKWFPFTTEQVDSAFITDVVTENVVRIDMIKKDSCIIDNSMINNFYIQVWYKNPNSSVYIDNTDENVLVGDNSIRIKDIQKIEKLSI